MNTPLHAPVARVLQMLARKEYAELARLTGQIRLAEQDIERAVLDYGRTVIEPPDDAFKFLDAVQVIGEPSRWSVVMPLWTKEEGRSDLTIELTIIADGHGYRVELDDLHVL